MFRYLGVFFGFNRRTSILRLSKGVFEVLATNGDSALGGDDFDQRVFCWIVEQGRFQPLSAGDMRLLLTKARDAKEALTEHTEVRVTAVLSTGEMMDATLTQAEFNAMTASLVSKTLAPTRKALRDAGLAVRDISEVTGFPEMLDGRVKTLHPAVHGGILARRGRPDDLEAIARHGIRPVDLVVVNLYPFARAAADPTTPFDALVEEGVAADALERVHAPIGLDIGAITPQEIAISIVAELIAVKHGKVTDPNAPAVSMRWDGALARR